VARHPAIADIRDLLTFRIAMLAAANDRMGQGWLQDLYGLRILEWRVLGLVAALQPVRFGEVARALLVDKGQLSRLVKQLGERGLVAAEPDGRDQRMVLLSLTAAGWALHARILPVALERNELVVSALSAGETAQLVRLLDKLQPFMEHRVEEADRAAAASPAIHRPDKQEATRTTGGDGR
jgi:DNA-binding MarR family transcriptional regulator